MNVGTWLHETVARLEAASITTARLDALVLLEDATDKDRAWLLAHTEHIMPKQALSLLNKQVERRIRHEPLAYIRGKSEFFGREFRVSPATLQPRPETETMFELLFEQMKNRRLEAGSLADIGTGSGCIAVTAKLERPELEVYATEINKDALKIAKSNAATHGADIKFYQGNLLEPIIESVSLPLKNLLVLANLPYVPDSHTINQAAMQEPAVAIFGGADGLDLYRELFAQFASIKHRISGTKCVLTESLPFQHETLADIAKSYGFLLKAADGFIQMFKG